MSTKQSQTMSPSDASLAGSKNPPYPMSDVLTDAEAITIMKDIPRDKWHEVRGWGIDRGRLGGLFEDTEGANELKIKIDTTLREWASKQNQEWASQQPESVNSPPPPSDTASQQPGSTPTGQSGSKRGHDPSYASSINKRRVVGPKRSPERQLVVGPKVPHDSWRR
jgi:hypothetical protein